MNVMRAKMKVESVLKTENAEELVMHPVCKADAYGDDGLDEDNTFAKFSPSGVLKLSVTNPALIGKINPGDAYYVDFTKVAAKETAQEA